MQELLVFSSPLMELELGLGSLSLWSLVHWRLKMLNPHTRFGCSLRIFDEGRIDAHTKTAKT